MGLTGALFASVSGLDTTSTAISVAGDNIANVNTPGFKERRVEFADVLGQSIASVGGFSQLGAGAKVSRVSTVFSQGTFESTGKISDLAIEGAGFFIVDGNAGRSYTRAGLFSFDNQGQFVNPEGLRVQGYGIDSTTGLSNGQLGDIQISSAISAPRTTSTLELTVNLDADASALGAFDPSNPNTTSSFRTVVTVYDSLGNGHPATIFFTKRGVNDWDVNVTLPPSETSIAPAVAGDSFVVQPPANTTMTFDNNGVLTAPLAATSISFGFSGLSGSPTQTIALSFGNLAGTGSSVDPTTQFSADSAASAILQDGFAAGTLQGVVIDNEGYLTGQFSNGETINIARMGLANFAAVGELVGIGNNRLIESRASGQALVGAPETGTFGSIRSSTIEQSNVDLATQFVKLIINQRAFQANTRTISVTNELLANLNALGQ